MAPSCSSRRRASCRCSGQVRLAERYDLAIMSTKGVSTTAARTLIDSLVGDGVPVFCIRDFDVSGFTIAGTLGRDTRRYSWTQRGRDRSRAPARGRSEVRAGTRGRLLPGRTAIARCATIRRIRRKIGAELKKNGATEEEIEFLLHHRVELNAFTSDQLVEWIEEKLVEHGVEKVVPEEETVAAAARGFARDLIAKRYLDTFADDIDREVDLYAGKPGQPRAVRGEDARGGPGAALGRCAAADRSGSRVERRL